MIEFKLPSLGSDMDQGTLVKWCVQAGQTVKKGDILAVVDTSKAAVDIEVWEDGTVHRLLASVGDTIPVGMPMALLLAPGEAAPPPGHEPPARPREQAPLPPRPPAGAAPPLAAPAAATTVATAATRARVSPAARRRAAQLHLDPDTLAGTGPDGAVTLDDVERAGRAAAAAPAATIATARATEMRKAIAAAMARSKREIPHYYLSEPIALRAALAWLQAFNAGRSITGRVLPAAVLLKAVARTLPSTPQLNGVFVDGVFEAAAAAHIGVAISLRGGGLVAPALHDVGRKPLSQVMAELADLAQRARAGSLRSSEMSDPTITVTNLGERSAQAVLGVIYPPQVALVGFGRIAERPWAVDGALTVMPVVTATLAADHRVSDGHLGASFLARLHAVLQDPQQLEE